MLRRVAFLLLIAACGGKTNEPPVATRIIGTDEGDPNDPTSGRYPVEDGGQLGVSEGGTLERCGGKVAAFTTDFESGNLADHFTVSEPDAFSIEPADPIAGQHSLAIAAAPHAYLTHSLPDACTVTITFDLRLSADIVTSGVKLVQVNAQHHWFALVLQPGGALQLAQTAVSTGPGTTGDGITTPSGTLATLGAGTPMRIGLAVDVSAKSIHVTVASLADGTATPATPPYLTMGGDDVAIEAIDFGDSTSFTGPTPTPSGTWWLDDVSVR